LASAPRIGALGLFLLARRSCIALRVVLVERSCLFRLCILLHHNLLIMITQRCSNNRTALSVFYEQEQRGGQAGASNHPTRSKPIQNHAPGTAVAAKFLPTL
jgi:hypothetical protein